MMKPFTLFFGAVVTVMTHCHGFAQNSVPLRVASKASKHNAVITTTPKSSAASRDGNVSDNLTSKEAKSASVIGGFDIEKTVEDSPPIADEPKLDEQNLDEQVLDEQKLHAQNLDEQVLDEQRFDENYDIDSVGSRTPLVSALVYIPETGNKARSVPLWRRLAPTLVCVAIVVTVLAKMVQLPFAKSQNDNKELENEEAEDHDAKKEDNFVGLENESVPSQEGIEMEISDYVGV
jgi:hypothetical protein